MVTVTVAGEHRIQVPSYYALAEKKKPGRPKKGRNGTGTHVLLAYWGFTRKRSPGSINEIVRAGAASASYELAAQTLKSQDVAISPEGIHQLVQHVGTQAIACRTTNHFALDERESLTGKRVAISLDGGRIRSRANKTGRRKAESKRHGYSTDWKEPKVLVIAELDEQGKKKKYTKPLYEATMGGKDETYALLKSLCQQLNLQDAAEIVLLGDGAPWLWDVFASLQKDLGITGKTTEVADFFHACEHITEITEAHSEKTPKEQRAWYRELKRLLRAGKHCQFCEAVEREADVHSLPMLKEKLTYFRRHEARMHYDQYEKAKLPIGSGIIESAVRRVVNGRLKAPGSFWKVENIERMLVVRCALLAGRWDVFMANFIGAVRLGGVGVG